MSSVMLSLEDDSPLVRTTAAIELGLKLGPSSPERVILCLLDAVRNWQPLVEAYDALPFVDEHVVAHIGLSLGRIRNSKSYPAILPLCDLLEEVWGDGALVLGHGLLSLCFGSQEEPFPPNFLHVLDVLAHSQMFHAFTVNASQVLRDWGLPGEPEALAELVASLQREDDPEAALRAQMTPNRHG